MAGRCRDVQKGSSLLRLPCCRLAHIDLQRDKSCCMAHGILVWRVPTDAGGWDCGLLGLDSPTVLLLHRQGR